MSEWIRKKIWCSWRTLKKCYSEDGVETGNYKIVDRFTIGYIQHQTKRPIIAAIFLDILAVRFRNHVEMCSENTTRITYYAIDYTNVKICSIFFSFLPSSKRELLQNIWNLFRVNHPVYLVIFLFSTSCYQLVNSTESCSALLYIHTEVPTTSLAQCMT